MSFFSCSRFLRVGFVMLGTAVALLGCDGPTTMDESVIGSAGLSLWLEKNDIPVLARPRYGEYSADDVSLRILPLLDTQSGTAGPLSIPKVYKPGDDIQRRIHLSYILEKLKLKKTLLVLPKWLSAVPLRDEIHSSLLIRKKNNYLSGLLEKLGVGHLKFADLNEKFQTLALGKGREKSSSSRKPGFVTLYSPQVFDPSSLAQNCVATVSSDRGVLIAKCNLDEEHILSKAEKKKTFKIVAPKTTETDEVEDVELGPYETEFYILSDPDLMNNHGLTLAGNAASSIDLVNDLRAGDEKPVFVDTTIVDVLRRSGEPKRDFSKPETDFSKYFSYPFSLLWLSGLLVFVIALWRGSVRFGPLMKVYADQVEASKKASIHAKAHILRLSGQDQALAAEFAKTQMLALAHRFLGEAGNADESLLRKRLLILVPEIATDLIDAADALYSIDIQISAVELARRIDLFDTQYRRVSDAVGHISRRH